MNESYLKNVKILKALGDPNRLLIVDMLSCGELCACKILEQFRITQPTLSHHMKILCDCGLVSGRKDGKWMHYSLSPQGTGAFKSFVNGLLSEKEDCICKEAYTGTDR